MVRVALQHFFQERFSPLPFAQAQAGPAPAETRRWFPAGTANRRRTAASSAARWRNNQSSPRTSGVAARKPAVRAKVFSPSLFGRALPGQGGVISHLRKRADAHLLEIALEIRRREPVFARGFLFAARIQRDAEPIMDVALVGEQMLRLAEIARRGERVLKMVGGRGRIAAARSAARPERQLGADVLAQRPAFAAFPRLELAAGQRAPAPSSGWPVWL